MPLGPDGQGRVGFRVAAGVGEDPGVVELDGHVLEGPVVSVGVHAQGHRGAGAECGEQQVLAEERPRGRRSHGRINR